MGQIRAAVSYVIDRATMKGERTGTVIIILTYVD